MIAVAMMICLIFFICCCKVAGDTDNRTYNEKTLDDDITMDDIMDQLTYDDEFVRKEDK